MPEGRDAAVSPSRRLRTAKGDPTRPLTKRWICSECGCTEARACEGGCYWSAFRVCSECASPLQIQRYRKLGSEALWPVQPEHTVTLAQLAVKLKVNASSLRVRILQAGIKADGTWYDGHFSCNIFKESTAERIAAALERLPLHTGRGRPPKAAK